MKLITSKASGEEKGHSKSEQQFVADQSFKGSHQAQESMKKRAVDEEYIRECNGRHKDNCAENF